MTEMVERCARALRESRGFVQPWQKLSRGAKENARKEARAVLEALREPTEEMVDRFVSRALCVSVHGEGGWSEYARGQWRTMIDAAIGGK